MSGHAQWVNISWSGIEPPDRTGILSFAHANDVVALYLADGDSLNTTLQDPFTYVYPRLVSKEDWLAGKGSYSFWLVNHRVPIIATYLRGFGYANDTIMTSLVIPNDSPNLPMQPNLAVMPADSSGGQVRISWSTRDAGSAALPPRVEWGRKSGRYSAATNASQSTYTREDLCGLTAAGSGWASPGIITTAVMNNLRPATRYYYRFGSNEFGFSEEFSFKTSPIDKVRLLAWADHGAYNPDNSRPVLGTFADQIDNVVGLPDPGIAITVITALSACLGVAPQNGASVVTPALVAEAKSGRYDAAAVNGDLSYAYGSIQRWDTWLYQITSIATAMPLILSPGNHESDSPMLPGFMFGNGADSGGECGVPYEQRMQPPNVAPRKEWYSINKGPIHFLQFSTEQDFTQGSEQYDFILQDLASVDRKRTPWVVAGFHRPMYVDDPDASSPNGNVVVSALLREHLEPLFAEFQVDMTWTGHVHAYHRSCPVMKGACLGYTDAGEARGPVHVVMGHAGGAPGLVTFKEQPSWAETDFVPKFGYCTVEATRTSLTLRAYGGDEPNLSTLPLIDKVTLRKPKGWRPNRVAAGALYKRTVAVPPPETTYTSQNLEKLLGQVPEVIKRGGAVTLELAAACFGPLSGAYKLTNGPVLPLMNGKQAWEYQYAMYTFLKGAWAPGANATADAPLLATLDYAYDVVVKGRQRLGTPAPGCMVL